MFAYRRLLGNADKVLPKGVYIIQCSTDESGGGLAFYVSLVPGQGDMATLDDLNKIPLSVVDEAKLNAEKCCHKELGPPTCIAALHVD